MTFGRVFVQAGRSRLPPLVARPFVVTLVSNPIVTPIRFGMRNLPLAAVDILVVWGSIIGVMPVWPIIAVSVQNVVIAGCSWDGPPRH